jgi:predicted nucleotidyltransferase component of viral defense system
MADFAASIAQKLLLFAKANAQDYTSVLTRYGLERLLYRLSQSPHADMFLLKGALLFLLWHDLPHRPTRDIDLLGFGPEDVTSIEAVFRDLCLIDGDDAVRFDPTSVKAVAIRKQTGYGGVRVSLVGKLKNMQLPVQVDVGFGDVVTPKAEMEVFPVILPAVPAPTLRVYPKFTVCAEKFQAMSSFGMANTRLKDYYDVWLLLQEDSLDDVTLGKAIAATFNRRKTPIAPSWPLGLTDEFSGDPGKEQQWLAFLRKNGLAAPDLKTVVGQLRIRLAKPLALARGTLQ